MGTSFDFDIDATALINHEGNLFIQTSQSFSSSDYDRLEVEVHVNIGGGKSLFDLALL